MKILIAVSSYNRKILTALCLQNLSLYKTENCRLVVYDDASTEYDSSFLMQFSDEVFRFPKNVGVSASKARALRDFVYRFTDFDLCYFTDNDTIHDPNFVEILMNAFRFQEKKTIKMPVGLFNSKFHLDSRISEIDHFFISKTCPGVSQCFDRDMATSIVTALNTDPYLEFFKESLNTGISGADFDYKWPAVLNVPFLISKISYVEHFCRDRYQKGLHSPYAIFSYSKAIQDFDSDSAINSSSFLKHNRKNIIKKILGSRILFLGGFLISLFTYKFSIKKY